ncbi:hypothetical protein SAMN02745166_02026 [Prosthecobacter debontii]|uniref:Uncharacterized protein n=1 Tax=Prosthecobacter debontii TaxID=48467 RepID=A0A1T4XU05_9BACT|nr:hypothetical protein [Prosthecobacter debontii]SKA93017.1 hypothetical protein SAMN02745166_02026 [Prosthecobacter debontii]
MSLGIIPVFLPELKTTKFNFDFDGSTTLDFAEELDELAGELGVASLADFSDCREAPEGYEGAPWELDEVLGPWTDWFAATAGEETWTRLHAHLKDDPESLSDPDAVPYLLEELSEFIRVLDAAVKEGAQFRLSVVS